jgi:hypothetical protein
LSRQGPILYYLDEMSKTMPGAAQAVRGFSRRMVAFRRFIMTYDHYLFAFNVGEFATKIYYMIAGSVRWRPSTFPSCGDRPSGDGIAKAIESLGTKALLDRFMVDRRLPTKVTTS